MYDPDSQNVSDVVIAEHDVRFCWLAALVINRADLLTPAASEQACA